MTALQHTRLTAFVSILAATSIAAPMLLTPVAAYAQPKKPDKKKGLKESLTGEAREAFERAVDLFTKGKNPSGALAEFERAYKVSKDPRLLYNMAICERDLSRYSRAINLLNRELSEGASTLSDADVDRTKELIASLGAYTSTITINSSETGAKVFIDDVEAGETPVAQPITVDVGERKIVVKKEGFLDFSKVVTVASKTPLTVEAKLDPAVKKGKLIVRASGAPDITVRVDGVDVGPAPWEGAVTASKHTVELRARGFVTETRTESVEYQETRVIEIAMRADQGKIRIETDNEKNSISIDNAPVGKGTWEGVLSTGAHSLSVSRDGYESASQELNVQTDSTRTIRITLKSKGGIPVYWWVVGGVVLVGAGVGVYFATRPKTEDPQPGTLAPGVTPVGIRF